MLQLWEPQQLTVPQYGGATVLHAPLLQISATIGSHPSPTLCCIRVGLSQMSGLCASFLGWSLALFTAPKVNMLHRACHVLPGAVIRLGPSARASACSLQGAAPSPKDLRLLLFTNIHGKFLFFFWVPCKNRMHEIHYHM